MEKLEQKIIPINGVDTNVVDLGQGPLVLFIHGLPGSWYSWHHHISFIASTGYRAVVPDMTGYGDTTGAPIYDPWKFSMFQLVSNLISLLDAMSPNEDKVFVAGVGWGNYVAFHLCSHRLGQARNLVNLNNAYSPWNHMLLLIDKNPDELEAEIKAESKNILNEEEEDLGPFALGINRGDIESSIVPMEKIERKFIPIHGIKMHFAELGEGPLVLFIHDLPDYWYSWRHHMAFVASRGYRAVAPDVRGYGDITGAPNFDTSKFSMYHLVGELKSFVEAIAPNEDKAFVVGHDWGAFVSCHVCLFRQKHARNLVNLSDPWNPVMIPVERFRSYYRDGRHYIQGFQIQRLCFKDQNDMEAESKKGVTEDALKNINHELNTCTDPNPVSIEFEEMNEDYWPVNTIKIHGIPRYVSKEDLLNYFSTFGVITHFECNSSRNISCTIKYETFEYKNAAMKTLHTTNPDMIFHDAAFPQLCLSCRNGW